MPAKPRHPNQQNPHAAALDAALAESTVPAVSRAVAILNLLGRSREPLGVQAVARALNIIPSTALHILRTLVKEEWVAMDPATKLYALSAGVLTLARQWLDQDRFTAVAQPVLDRLAREQGLTAIGVQLVGLEHMIVVAMARSESMIQLHTQIGSRFPALISASGRCLAAFGGCEPAELQRRFKALRWDRAPTPEQWQAQVADTRRQGYGLDRNHYIAGVTVLAAPVYGIAGRLSHCLVLVGLSGQLGEAALGALGEQLRDRAADLSRQLGG